MKKLFLLLLLSGCMVGPNYRRPCVEIPEEWRTPLKGTDFDITWWDQFNDPSLSELIYVALNENKDLWIATARIDEFMGYHRITRSDLFPKVYGSGVSGEERTSDLIYPPTDFISNPEHYNELFLKGSWEIDLWGKLRRANQASSADLFASEEARLFVIQTLVSAVATTYIDLLRTDEQLKVSLQTAESRKKSLDLFEQQYKAGIISRIIYSQAVYEYEVAMSRIPFFEKLVAQIENRLSILIGQNPGPIVRGSTINTIALPEIPEGLPSSLLERRPDIRQAEFQLIAANARIGVAKASYFPSISLTGRYGNASHDMKDLFTAPARAWNWFVPVNVPIFTAGELAGSVQVATAQ
jgi:multidrug efflux system outer membrane protein